MPQEPKSREYINGMLAGLKIASIYAADTERRMTVEDIQGEIDTVMNIPVKKDEKPLSSEAIINIEIKDRNNSLAEYNEKVERANMLTKQLTESLLDLPIFQQPTIELTQGDLNQE